MSRIPDIIIERVLLGEATSEQRARVMANPDAVARLEELRLEDAAFFERLAADDVVPQIERKVHVARTRDAVKARTRTWTQLGAVLVPLSAAAVGLMALNTTPSTDQLEPPLREVHDPDDGLILAKGPPARLHVYRQHQGASKSLRPGTVLRRGDQLQLAYTSTRPSHGVMFSIDGNRQVTLHAPDDHKTALKPGHNLLPHAYELDNAPDFERFFFVVSDRPVSVEQVLDAGEALAKSEDPQHGELLLPDELTALDFNLRKDVVP